MGFSWVKFRDNTVESFRDAGAKGILHASGYSSNTGEIRDDAYNYDAQGNKIGINRNYAERIAQLYSSQKKSDDTNPVIGLAASTNEINPINTTPISKWTPYKSKTDNGQVTTEAGYVNGGPAAKLSVDENSETRKHYDNQRDDQFLLKLPDWGYDDFINERAIWQKGLSSIFDEPAWFYFKVIFDFESSTGLFGDLLNAGTLYKNNSALTYLKSCSKSYYQEKITNRITALYKFASLLSYITTNAPWYFKSIKGLDKASAPILQDFSQEKSIELELNSDAIDMRLSTLMSLYQYACFDNINGKEIIPSNLRMFNMSVILFQAPLRFLHTSYSSSKKTLMPEINSKVMEKYSKKLKLDALQIINNHKFESTTLGLTRKKYKRMTYMNGDKSNYSDMMSMKIFTFEGCMFDPNTFAAMIPGSVSNETPFKIGETSIKITYTRCYTHTMNEFFGMMFGTDGFYFNNYATYQSKHGNSDDYNASTEGYWNKQIERYNTLAESFEDILGGSSVFGLPQTRTFKRAIDATEAVMKGIINDSDILNKIGTHTLMKVLERSVDTNATQGNLYGSNVGISFNNGGSMIKSDYYEKKLEQLKKGYRHVDRKNTETSNENYNDATKSYNSKDDKDLQEALQEIKYGSHTYTEPPHQWDMSTDFDLQKYINKFKKEPNTNNI